MLGSRSQATPPSLPTDRTALPLPRRPPDPADASGDHVRRWYENELGWPTVPADPRNPADPGDRGDPVRLRVGERFDVLEVPAEAGRAGLRHLAPASPVAVCGNRMRLLVAAGSAEELPGLLEWLEWGPLALDLTATGEGGVMDAPLPPEGAVRLGAAQRPEEARRLGDARRLEGALRLPRGRTGSLQGAAVWLRPPGPGCEVEASLPTLSALGGGGGAPDLVRLVNTVATRCHRLWLRRACARPEAPSRAGDQALAFS
ncbi:SCO3374 family protein [Streptomyces sp. NPDC005799]|uniref:SCO3374 family protein n=1 Tax=Streptomyces sp. NPDC005799 TaxID=3154678 RepID=UPI0033CC9490